MIATGEKQMPAFERPTVTLHYEDTGGDLPAVVFLHGWCDSSGGWGGLTAALRGSFRCIAPDMRGPGQSGLPRDHCYSAEALSNDVAAICESLDVVRPVVIGHSFGGYLAAEISRRFPRFARGVVIEDQVLDLRGFGSQMRTLEAVIRSPETHMAFRKQLFDSMISSAMPPADRELVHRAMEATPVEVGQALWAPLFEFTLPELGERSDALMAALGNQPSLSLDSQPQPDYYAKLEGFAPGTRTEVIESGHWVHLERRADVLAALDRFFASLG